MRAEERLKQYMEKMHKIGVRIYQIGLKTVQALTLLLSAGLAICSLFWGYYAEDMTTQASVPHTEPFLLHLPGMLVLGALAVLLLKFVCTHVKAKRILLPAIALCWICFCGLLLIPLGRSLPAADSASVYSIAQALASGQMGVIHPTDSYLSYYPQQIGLVAFYEIIIRLWNLLSIPYAPYYILQCVNVLMACAIVYFQYKTTYLLFKSELAATAYLYLAMLNAPLIIYTSFVYGELPSFAFLSGGFYLLLRYFQRLSSHGRRRWAAAAGSLLMLTVGVALRKNSLIVIIAIVLVLLWEWLRSRRHELLLCIIVLSVSCTAVLPAIQRIYEYRAGNTLATGVPAISYVAMGMQESSRGNGWYNGFNFYTYENCHMDTALTTQESITAIRASLSAFCEEPGYAFRFYADKFLSQWTDGSYFCRQATQNHTPQRAPIVASLYEGSLSRPFNHYCNIYQLLVYGSTLLCLLRMRRSGNMTQDTLPSLLPYTGMIAVLGGFLFHMVWEANSRYILPYFLLLLPYAAQGLGILAARINKR